MSGFSIQQSGYFSGRGGRLEFFAWALFLSFVPPLVAKILTLGAVGWAATLVWALAYRRRFHDLGLSGKWGLAIILLMMTPSLAAFLPGGVVVFQALERGDYRTALQSPLYLVLAFGSILIQFVINIALCLWPGQNKRNAYGPSRKKPGKSSADAESLT